MKRFQCRANHQNYINPTVPVKIWCPSRQLLCKLIEESSASKNSTVRPTKKKNCACPKVDKEKEILANDCSVLYKKVKDVKAELKDAKFNLEEVRLENSSLREKIKMLQKK